MTEDLKHVKKELKEQNEFLHSMLRSFEDIKKGRVKRFKFKTTQRVRLFKTE